MAEDLAPYKQLQAGLNAAFEALYAAKTAKDIALAKEGLVGLGYATAGSALGPAFAVISHSNTVSGLAGNSWNAKLTISS